MWRRHTPRLVTFTHFCFRTLNSDSKKLVSVQLLFVARSKKKKKNYKSRNVVHWYQLYMEQQYVNSIFQIMRMLECLTKQWCQISHNTHTHTQKVYTINLDEIGTQEYYFFVIYSNSQLVLNLWLKNNIYSFMYTLKKQFICGSIERCFLN